MALSPLPQENLQEIGIVITMPNFRKFIPYRAPKLQSLRMLSLALGSGVLMSLAAAPANLWPIAWVALAPLWVLVTTSRYPLACAIAWGIGYHGLTISWITGLHPLMWLGVPWLASLAIALFCWGFITLWGTAATLLWAWVMQEAITGKRSPSGGASPVTGSPNLSQPSLGRSLRRVFIGTAVWCGLEFLLNLTPLSWTSLSFTQSPGNLVILHLGQLSGPLMVSAAIAAVNGLLAEAWVAYYQRTNYQRLTISLSTSALILLVVSHGVGAFLYTRPLLDQSTSELAIGIVQGNIPTREKLSGEGIRRAIRSYVSGYEVLASQGVDAVLTPEGALPLFWDPDRNPFYQAVLERKVSAWLGTFVASDRRITQSLLSISGEGKVVGRYNKIRLVPLGEYIPFQDVLGPFINRLSPIEANMLPGRPDQRFETPFGRAIASICYESVFPELFRAQAADDGQFILTASNLDPYSEMLMAQHQAHDLMRAIETDRWAVRATNTGYSGVIDPHGRIRVRSRPNTYELLSAKIYRRQTKTLYVRWGDWLTPSLLVIAVLLLVLQKLGANRNTTSR